MKLKLNNGLEVPQVGFGTWPMKKDECFNAVVNGKVLKTLRTMHRRVRAFVLEEEQGFFGPRNPNNVHFCWFELLLNKLATNRQNCKGQRLETTPLA